MTAGVILPLTSEAEVGMPADRAKNRAPRNIFYLALVIVAVLFTLTACLYGVMMLIAVRNGDLSTASSSLVVDSQHPLLVFMDKHGFGLMLWELGLLGICTVLAIGLDWFRQRRDSRGEPSSPLS
jgi:hypothetical protein